MTNTTRNTGIQRGPGWMMVPRPLTLLLAFWTMNSPVHSQTPVRLIHDANVNSLVFITAKRENANGIQDVETGTGFIVESRGYVLTCTHLIPEGDHAHTKLTGTVGGRYEHVYPLSFVTSDNLSAKGLTLLKLPEKSWRSVESGAQAEEGAEIVALGFPSDKDLASVSGSITDVDNDGRWLTDAAVSEGMSGGPVFDRSGKLVGIVYGGYPDAPALKQIIPISLATSLLQDASSRLLPIKPASSQESPPGDFENDLLVSPTPTPTPDSTAAPSVTHPNYHFTPTPQRERQDVVQRGSPVRTMSPAARSQVVRVIVAAQKVIADWYPEEGRFFGGTDQDCVAVLNRLNGVDKAERTDTMERIKMTINLIRTCRATLNGAGVTPQKDWQDRSKKRIEELDAYVNELAKEFEVKVE